MDKQHSDHIDNRIRQAAEGITTPVTEEAWQQMELLLDKQEKKKRRRGIFWWWYILFFGLITASGLWYYYGKPNQASDSPQLSTITGKVENGRNNKGSVKAGPEQDNNLPPVAGSNSTLPRGDKGVIGTSKPETMTNSSLPPIPLPGNKYLSVGKKKIRTEGGITRPVSGSLRKAKTSTSKKSGKLKADQDDAQKGEPQTSANQASANNNLATTPTQDIESQIPEPKMPGSDSTIAKAGEPGKKEVPGDDSLVLKTPDRKPKNSDPVNKPGLFVTASFEKDATSIDKISLKTFKPVYGLGVGYRFTNRLSVQTGFYAGRKIYRAGPGDYKLRQGTNVRDIIFIDAVCYIYEVPLLVRYDVIAKRKYNVYAATGLSTYFFKKENYDFHYLNLTGAYRRMAYSYKNNTDYFSVADFSVGFEYKILNRLYIQAEPYMKVPLSGLGEGKVKLTSAGILAGLRYQPFYKKSKK